jgi:hypothetical protein
MDAAQPQCLASAIKKTSVPLVILLTLITGGIYLPIWFLTRREAINSLQSKEKLGKGIFVAGIAAFTLALLASIYSGYTQGLSTVQDSMAMSQAALSVNGFELAADIVCLLALVPIVYQAFRVKRILHDHYHEMLGRDVTFSGFYTFLFLNWYLQYKINRLD